MKKLLLFFLILLIISSCKTNQDSTKADWRVGTTAITLNFLKNSPPSLLFDENPIDVALEVRNKGAYQVSPKIYLTGFDTNIIQGLESVTLDSSNLMAKDKFNEEGGYTIAKATGNIDLLDEVNSFKTKIVAAACYTYRTEASFDICIDPSPNKFDKEDSCSISTISSTSGQAAPVAITSIQEQSTADKILFTITLKNQGKGDLVDLNQINNADKCKSSFDFQDLNKIRVNEVKIIDEVLTCEETDITLYDGTGYLYCSKTINDELAPAYKSILSISVEYGYRNLVSTDLEIRR